MKTPLVSVSALALCVSIFSGYPIEVQAISDDTTPLSRHLPLITVYKSSTCGCCKKWVSYLEHEGFTVHAINHKNVNEIKVANGLTDPSLKSCHTALVDGYVIEGHVPASDIERLLTERPDIAGLTAPGMPRMSPGMSSLVPKNYTVFAFQKDGQRRVFSSY